jgi:hypothetical protein
MNISDPEFHLQTARTLPENEVHLWRLDVEPLAVSEDRWQQLLSADEQVRAKRFLICASPPRVRRDAWGNL